MQQLCILIALMFTGCAARVAVSGRYAQTISQGDIEEIKQLISGFEGGRYEFIRISAYARNCAEIATTQIRGSATTDRYLEACRRPRGWHLQKRSDPPPTVSRISKEDLAHALH